MTAVLLGSAENVQVDEVANWTPWKVGTPSTAVVWRSLRTRVFRTTSRLDPLMIGSIKAVAAVTRCPPAICQKWRKQHIVNTRQRLQLPIHATHTVCCCQPAKEVIESLVNILDARSAYLGGRRTDTNHISAVNVRIERKLTTNLA